MDKLDRRSVVVDTTNSAKARMRKLEVEHDNRTWWKAVGGHGNSESRCCAERENAKSFTGPELRAIARPVHIQHVP